MEAYVTEEGRERQARWFKIKLYGSLLLATAVIAGVFYALQYTDFLTVSIKVQGNKRSSVDTVIAHSGTKIQENFWGGVFGFMNYFSWPAAMDVRTPLIASVEVQRELFKKQITLTVHERQPYGVFCLSDKSQCYWFDDQGVLFEPSPVPEGSLIIKVLSDAVMQAVPGNEIITSRFMDTFFQILHFFKDNQFGVDRYEIKNQLQEVHITLANGLLVRVSLRFDPKASLAALKTLYEKSELQKVAYVDLTVENRIYLKPK